MSATESARLVASIFFRATLIATPAVPNAFSNVGVKNITRISGSPAGAFLVELDETVDYKRCLVEVQPSNNVEFSATVSEESGGPRLEVRTYNAAGALTDCDFWLEVKQSVAALHEDQRFL
jgi:hypothetical protein